MTEFNIKFNKTDHGEPKLPVVFLDGGILFPQNVIVVQGLAGFRLEDVNNQNLEGVKVCVLARSYEGLLTLSITEGDETQSAASYGTVANVSGVTKLGNGQFGLILKGSKAVKIDSLEQTDGRYQAVVKPVEHIYPSESLEAKSAFKMLKTLSMELLRSSSLGSQESFTLINSTEDPLIMCNLVASHLTSSLQEKVDLLSCSEVSDLVEKVTNALVKESELSDMIIGIQDKVKADVNTNMKRAFLREQLEAMKKELGELDGSKGEIYDLQARAKESGLSDENCNTILKELDRMEMMPPGSPEYMVSHNYINWVLDLPWQKEKIPPKTIAEAKEILNHDHFGLDKVKEKVLEYVATMNHIGTTKNAQILLLVGPPGVGKTSMAKSIAKSLNRKYERISLGGVDDVSEIRGHRRTYIGALPGRIIDALKKTGSNSPLILLDEIDKVGRSHKGDLGAALLEVLDPEQNKKFVDHYISIPFDLSNVVFIATANSLDGISAPLLDRMEVLSVSGYDEEEKVAISKKYLIPSLIKQFDLRRSDLSLSPSLIKLIIRHYTRESGVRVLKQRLTSLARKSVCSLVEDRPQLKFTTDNISEYLGKPLVKADTFISKLPIGVSLGLAYTPYGGDVLYVEAVKFKASSGKGYLKLTGQLGDVMKESASTVLSYLSANCDSYNFDRNEIESNNIHIHFPEGAVPKDGPSAGVALLSCLAGLFSGKPLSKNIAMTGEITLRGDVLPVGGIREKVMAAHRAGVYKVIIPAANWFDLDDVPGKVLERMEFYPISRMDEALDIFGVAKQSFDNKISSRKFRKSTDKLRVPLKKWQPSQIENFLT